MFEYLYFIIEFIALVALVSQYKKLDSTRYVYFLPYLLFIVIYEAGSIYNLFNINHSNGWITNIVVTIEYLFYSWFIIGLLAPRLRNRLYAVTAIILAFTIADALFIQDFWRLITIAMLVQYCMLIVLVCMYFYQLMQQPEQLSLIRLPDFWVNTGLLFFCLIEFMFFAAYTHMALKNNYQYFALWRVIANMAILILYSCLSVSFLCLSKNKKLSF